jgi:hypothetical protein
MRRNDPDVIGFRPETTVRGFSHEEGWARRALDDRDDR